MSAPKNKYALKATRDTRTNRVTIHDIMEVPPGREGYSFRHPTLHVAEGLRIFDTREEAERAAAMEREILRLSELPPEELASILRNRQTRMREALGGPGWRVLLKLAGEKRDVIDSYMMGRLAPSPRRVARIKYAADRLLEFAEGLEPQLPPPEGPAGNPNMSRGGNPELPYVRKWHRAKRPTPADD